jgi:hypothetical protein
LNTEIQFLTAQNNALSATQNWEINQKTVNNWLLKLYNDEPLNPNQEPAVLALANQCPLTEGDAVYQARGIYNSQFDNNKAFNDQQLCVSAGNRNSKEISGSTNEISVYPNPAGEILFINGYKSDSKYQIFNQLGTEVSNGMLDNPALSISEFQSGVYWLHIFQPDLRPQTVKFIVVH